MRRMVEFVVDKRAEVTVGMFAFEQLNNLVERSKSGVSGKSVVDMQV